MSDEQRKSRIERQGRINTSINRYREIIRKLIRKKKEELYGDGDGEITPPEPNIVSSPN